MTDAPTTSDEAFLQAKAGFTFKGEPLLPYSASRKVAAQSMGLLFPFVPDAEEAQETGVYQGMLADVIIVIWLCSLKNASEQTRDEVKAGEWNPSKALSKPQAAMEAAMEWAEKTGLADMNSETFLEAYKTFMAILTGISLSEFEVDAGNGSPQPEGDDDEKI